MKKTFALLCCITVAALQLHSQAIIYVTSAGAGSRDGSSWANALPGAYLRDNIFAATTPKQYWVAKGNYTFTGVLNLNYHSTISIYGGFSGIESSPDERNPSLNVTQFYNMANTFYAPSPASKIVLDGFTIANANAPSNVTLGDNPGGYGGGIYIVDGGGNVQINNVVFNNNKAAKGGAAIYIRSINGSSPTITNCAFSGNTCTGADGDYGGAIYIDAQNSGVVLCKPLITNCSFTNNKAQGFYSGGIGGAICVSAKGDNCIPQVNSCRFTGNTADGGGAIAAISYNGGNCNYTINNCIFEQNNAANGGALFNQCDNGGGVSPYVYNSIFYRNSTGGRGGAIYSKRISGAGATGATILNCDFVLNSAPVGSCICNDSAATQISNSIIWATSANSLLSGSLPAGVDVQYSFNIKNSLIKGGFAGNGNLDSDPAFRNINSPKGADNIWATADDGLVLTVNSPAIGTGDNYAPDKDILGVSRPAGTGVDIGAYEFNSTPVSAEITAGGDTTICGTGSVLLSAGTAPDWLFQWQKDGYNIGNSTNTLTANQSGSYRIIITNAANEKDTSNTINISINPKLSPAISITADKGNSICDGTPVTFTAAVTGAGDAPKYQWLLNGSPVGDNSKTYTADALANGDEISCTLTVNSPCAEPNPVSSDAIIMTVASTAAPTANIIAGGSTDICEGGSVVLTANGGSTPDYWEWLKDGESIPGTENESGITVQEAGTYTLVVHEGCGVNKDSVHVSVLSKLSPAISITADKGNSICDGTPVTFTAAVTGAGDAPKYQWLLNGSPVGDNSKTYTADALANGDEISCTLTVNSPCAEPNPVSSDAITMKIASSVTPPADITVKGDTIILKGDSVILEANTGTAPDYWEWLKDGKTIANSINKIRLTVKDSGIYTLIVHKGCGVNSASVHITFKQGALAVNILTFTGTQQNGTNVLKWSTAGASENEGFIIERSINGINFSSIGQVSERDNTSGNQSYTFIDRQPLPGNDFYRLSIIAKDGKISYSNIVKLAYKQQNILLSPNPAVNNICVVNTTANVPVYITDVLGKKIVTTIATEGTTNIDVHHLAAGMYYCIVGKISIPFIKTGN